MPDMRLGMRVRLGVVLSVLWIILGFVGQSVYDHHEAAEDAAAEYRLCMAPPALSNCSDYYARMYELSVSARSENKWITAFLPLLIGWLGAFVVVKVTRWVLAGRDTSQ